jgi:hypothetical protein
MFAKFVRCVAALAVIVNIVGNTGVVHADRGASPSIGVQKFALPRASQPQPLGLPALSIPPASSLGVQFVHVATAASILSNATVIDHPLTNGHPDAKIIVTPNWNPGGVGGTADDHPIGVEYNGGQWWIFNQDGAAMPPGAAFNVIIPSANIFVHTATAVSGDHTFIDNILTNSNPSAILLVTPNQDPGGICPCVNANFPIGVSYSGTDSKWKIFNQDGTAMPLNVSFNVFVLTAGAGVFVQTATVENIGGGATLIDNPLTNGHPNAIVFATPNLTPGGVTDAHPIAVFYDGSQWAIINQGPTDVPLDASFNVLVLVPVSDIFVHTTTADNGGGVAPYTILDNALTNGHSNAIVFTTPNLNPGGGAGTYHNHNIGVFYNGSLWGIQNQDALTKMSVGAAFNVLVPNPDTSVFVHKATVGNILSHSTVIDYPLTNLNPGGVGGAYDDRPIGVFYDGSKWRIYNEDGSAMPVGAAFNVFVPTASPGVGVFVQTATGINSGANFTMIDNALANGNPNAILLVTPNYNPGGVGGTNANFPIGVGYVGDVGIGRWAIINQNGVSSPIPPNASFNVYVDANYKLYLPLIIR